MIIIIIDNPPPPKKKNHTKVSGGFELDIIQDSTTTYND